MNITEEAFRQRLSRGRKQIQNFMTQKCCLVNPENPCACAKLIPYEIKIKMLDPENLRFANHRCHARDTESAISQLRELDELRRVAVLFRSRPDDSAPERFVELTKKLVESGRLKMLNSR